MVSRDQYMDWKTLLSKVKSMVEKFKEQREKEGFDTSETNSGIKPNIKDKSSL